MGLYDRSYMHRSGGGFPSDGRKTIFNLIIVNVIVWLLAMVSPPLGEGLLLTSDGIRNFEIYRIVTAAFLHFDFWHILLNMWGLYLFGTIAAPYLGGKRTLILYFVSGIAGNLLFLAFNWGSPFALLGASGAVYGITIAAAMFEPERRFVMLFMPFRPIKTSTMVIVFTVIEILSSLGGQDGVAHLAHLGGFIGGYLYLKLLRIPLAWDPLGKLLSGGRAPGDDSRRYDKYDYRDVPGDRSPGRPVPQHEVDRLLDKISTTGVNSLTEEELATLRRVREQMNHPGR